MTAASVRVAAATECTAQPTETTRGVPSIRLAQMAAGDFASGDRCWRYDRDHASHDAAQGFLGPWDPMVQQCWRYALADAQRRTGVAIHHGVLVVNHEHLTVTPSEDKLPEFVRRRIVM